MRFFPDHLEARDLRFFPDITYTVFSDMKYTVQRRIFSHALSLSLSPSSLSIPFSLILSHFIYLARGGWGGRRVGLE